MTADSSRGVSALATMLAQLASGEPIRAADFAGRHGFARSSVFDLARRLQTLGFAARDDDGRLLAGPAAYDFAWSLHGLQGLRGPAQAMLLWLRDHVEAGAAIMVGDEELLSVPGPTLKEINAITRQSAPVCDREGGERLRLVLHLGVHSDAAIAAQALRRAVATLENFLEASA